MASCQAHRILIRPAVSKALAVQELMYELMYELKLVLPARPFQHQGFAQMSQTRDGGQAARYVVHWAATLHLLVT